MRFYNLRMNPSSAVSNAPADIIEPVTADPSRSFDSRDWWALALISVAFALLLAASWQRWTQPIIDHGREMNLPARVLSGEQLYRDVQFLYGPFAPYFNASLYRLFGIRLHVLHASGAVSAALILLLIYYLARRLLGVWEAALVTGMVLVICALKYTGNYVSPYAYAALYGFLFALASLASTMRYLGAGRARWMASAGAAAALALITKPEVAGAALASAALALLLQSRSARRWRWRDGLVFALPLLAIAAGAWGYILTRVPWPVLRDDNHILFTNMPPQLVYFNRFVSGLSEWPRSLAYPVAGLGAFAVWCGASAIIGALTASRKMPRRSPEWRRVFLIGLASTAGGGLLWGAMVLIAGAQSNVTPLSAAPILLGAVIATLVTRIYRVSREGGESSGRESLLLVMAIFALLAILRVILKVTASAPYTPFFLPVPLIIILYLLLRWWPAQIGATGLLEVAVRRAAMTLVALMIVGTGINSAYRWRARMNYLVQARRGSFYTEAPIGEPLAAAIRAVAERTAPGDEVLTLPQATMINFLAERRYPLMMEIIHPGFLAGIGEHAAIERIRERRVKLILVVNLLTPEFRDRVFGVDYNRDLLRWVEENYQPVQRFDSAWSGTSQLGDNIFFILAYELKK
jgi:4-amino-4-deoxy-L-arabinose transferase-like glycosyltransferase